jgi:diketogulonate reductase-like aldo/keto reductase
MGMRHREIQGGVYTGSRVGDLLRGAECRRAVLHALAVGYRQIDTAESYDNEAEVGRAIRESPADREDTFLTTKVWFDHLERGAFLRAVAAGLHRLDTDYVDLLLIHWPNPDVPLRETLGAILELKAAHTVRHIGVSNFTPALVEEALAVTPIFCNQVECHPYLAQERLRALATRGSYAHRLLTAGTGPCDGR